MSSRSGFGSDGFGGGQAANGMIQDYRASEYVAALGGASTPLVGGLTAGQRFTIYRDCYCEGASFYWATSAGTETLTVRLYDSGGVVIADLTADVTATPTLYRLPWEDGTVDMQPYLGEQLIVCAYQSGDEYYSRIAAALFGTPTIVGPGVVSDGNIYVAGLAMPTTLTAVETYAIDANLRSKL